MDFITTFTVHWALLASEREEEEKSYLKKEEKKLFQKKKKKKKVISILVLAQISFSEHSFAPQDKPEYFFLHKVPFNILSAVN
jgi:hypothetical protein